MLLKHKGYFELKAFEIQQMQKEAFPELLLSIKEQELLRNEDCQ